MRDETKCMLTEMMKLCQDGADEGCPDTHLDKKLLLIPLMYLFS